MNENLKRIKGIGTELAARLATGDPSDPTFASGVNGLIQDYNKARLAMANLTDGMERVFGPKDPLVQFLRNRTGRLPDRPDALPTKPAPALAQQPPTDPGAGQNAPTSDSTEGITVAGPGDLPANAPGLNGSPIVDSPSQAEWRTLKSQVPNDINASGQPGVAHPEIAPATGAADYRAAPKACSSKPSRTGSVATGPKRSSINSHNKTAPAPKTCSSKPSRTGSIATGPKRSSIDSHNKKDTHVNLRPRDPPAHANQVGINLLVTTQGASCRAPKLGTNLLVTTQGASCRAPNLGTNLLVTTKKVSFPPLATTRAARARMTNSRETTRTTCEEH